MHQIVPHETQQMATPVIVPRGRPLIGYITMGQGIIRVPIETGKFKMVMEHKKTDPTIMEFCFQSWNFTNFVQKFTKFACFFATTKKLGIDVEREMVMEN